jgi:hypothetical protein
MSKVALRCGVFAAVLTSLVLLSGCMGRPSDSAYIAYESMLRKDGKLRTDTAPADARYSADDLIRNFERIALRRESSAIRPGSEQNSTSLPLQRWHGPLRYQIHGAAATQKDRDDVAQLMARIAALTGLEIRETATDPNFRILITAPDERDRISSELAQINPRLSWAFEYWRTHSEIICSAYSKSEPGNRGHLVTAMAIIGSETTGVLRKACLHEEIVQALGLPNDHPDVRPSIFNDDGEFALMTDHDAQLLRILYDPRLAPGMTAPQAMPAVRAIVSDIFSRPAAPVPDLSQGKT